MGRRMSARGLELEQAQAVPDHFVDKRARRDLSHVPISAPPPPAAIRPSPASRTLVSLVSRGFSAAHYSRYGVSVVAMDRVGGGEKQLEDCTVSNALGTWFFSVVGALVAIPVGIKKKSLAPLVFFGTTGTMLDIIMGISQCEREHAERQMKLLEAQNLSTNAAAENESSESFSNLDK